MVRSRGAEQLFGLLDGRTLFEHLPEAEGIGHALGIEDRRAVAGEEHFVDRQGQARVVHARKTTEQTRKADGHEGVLSLRPVDRDQAVLVEQMPRV